MSTTIDLLIRSTYYLSQMAKSLILIGLIVIGSISLVVFLHEVSSLSETAELLIGVGSLFSMIGIFSLIALLSEVSFLVRSKRWSVVPGTVQSSRKEEVKITGDYASATFDQSAIFCRYEVDGKQYIIRERHLDKTNRQLKQLLSEYPVGMEVSVFYNPKKPKESTLKTKYNRIPIDLYLKTIIPLAIGILLFLLAFTLV